VLLRFAPRLLPLCLTTVGTLLVAALLAAVGSASASAQDETAAPDPSYGGVSSAVVPQPDGPPSIFIQAGGIVYNSWYANGGWPWYPIAAYTPPMGPPPGSLPYGFATSRAEAVLQPDGSPSIFFEGVGGSLWNYWYVSGAWDSAEIASSGAQSTPVAILQPNGAPSVFVIGPNNSLLNYWYIVGTGKWGEGTVSGAGSVFQAPAAVVDPQSTLPDVFAEGPSHYLIEYQYALGGTWSSAEVADTSGGAPAFSAPAAVVQPNGGISVFVVGPNHSLVNYWQPIYPPCESGLPCPIQPAQPCPTSTGSSAPCWNSATVAGQGSAYSSPAVVLQPDGAPTTFILGPSGSLLNYWYVPNPAEWGSGTVEPPGSTSQVFGVLVQTDGAPQVFSAHQDGSLWYSSYAQGSWNNVEWGVNDAPVETYTDPQ